MQKCCENYKHLYNCWLTEDLLLILEDLCLHVLKTSIDRTKFSKLSEWRAGGRLDHVRVPAETSSTPPPP